MRFPFGGHREAELSGGECVCRLPVHHKGARNITTPRRLGNPESSPITGGAASEWGATKILNYYHRPRWELVQIKNLTKSDAGLMKIHRTWTNLN
jgi:hypothetical protein